MSEPLPDVQLGKQQPSTKRALMLKDVLTGIPPIPMSVDHLAQESEWELGQNTRHGTCGPTSVANFRRLVVTALGLSTPVPTTDDVFDLYRRSGNPRFNPDLAMSDPNQDDNGVVMQTMLEALLVGGIGGVKPVAFAKIAADDMDTLDTAIALFGGVLLGLSLDKAQRTQAVWDHVTPADPWGGHAVLAGKYSDPDGTDSDRVDIVTWARDQSVTRAFVEAQEDEAWVVIWPEMLEHPSFLAGVDLSKLSEAFRALTGSELPVGPSAPVPAPPAAPEAAPIPAPGRGVTESLPWRIWYWFASRWIRTKSCK